MSNIIPTPPEAINAGPPPAVPAGWYADPQGSDRLRWWDGQSWTVRLIPSDNSALPASRRANDGPKPAVAGWHPDPYGSGKLRLWDGMRWTQKLVVQGSVPPREPLLIPSPPQGAASHPLAEIGFTLGICALFLGGLPWLGPFISLSAIFISLAGWLDHNPRHTRGSKVRAIIGFCLGIVYLFVGALVIFSPYSN